MKRIWWLASYPKSGNTWFRAFLTSLLQRDLEGPLLEHLEGGPIASAREVFEFETGVDSDELSFGEIQHLRPDVYRSFSRRARDPLYLKIHDARIDPSLKLGIIPPDATAGAIYIMRNPLDVAVSLAHFIGSDAAKASRQLTNESLAVGSGQRSGHTQLRQVLGSWSWHARSWIEHDDFPVLVLRYEDMLSDPVASFTQAVAFLNLPASPEAIAQAVEEARFEKLQQAEEAHGFAERPLKAKRFFRRGRAGAWRDELPQECQHQLLEAHNQVMQKYGYLDEVMQPVF